MIAAGMVYAIAVSGALGLSALALERSLALYRRPTRLVWLAALAGGVSIPLLTLAGWLPLGGRDQALGSLVGASLPPLVVGPLNAYRELGAWATPLDAILLGGWMTASAALLASLVVAVHRLQREGGTWERQELDGCTVVVSPSLGPALIGLLSTAIVVPAWFRDLPRQTRRLALLHEREHMQAGDTRLFLAAVLAVALVPWNPLMWWAFRRLRAAVEMDCDARVLMRGVHPGIYAGALLEVSEQARSLGAAWPALAEPESLLSRRITAMLAHRIRLRWPRAVLYGAATFALLVLACETPRPDRVTADLTGVRSDAIASSDVVPEGTPGLEPPERVSFPPPVYPKMLLEAGVEGSVVLSLVIGTDGRVEPGSIEILQASNRAFEAPARDAVARATFRPGRLNGKAVAVSVQMPLRFVIATEPTPPGARIAR